uniref:Glutathione S-transferase 10 n=1 Tax=Streltzoviella insularis TaxID=1206366 RepID=A0A7D5YS84_9NEOP|nr:glutathione S-transferase 10 [Streltzoviella insularis]
MAPKLYKMDASPPARAAMMVCDVHNVPLEMVDVNLIEKEHLKPEYLKKNPLHTVPMFEDGDFILQDSHAILIYLTEVYGKDDSLYPKETKQRAFVNQKLFFNNSILFTRLRNIAYPAIMEGVRKPSEKQLNDIKEAYGFLEEFFSRTKYLATNHITIADIAAFATVSSLIYIVSLDSKKYPRTHTWLKEMEKQSYSQKYNAPGVTQIGGMLQNLLDL